MSKPIVMEVPADSAEDEWIAWAQIALTYEGVDKALEILGAYLALNPERADDLAAAWMNDHPAPVVATVVPR